MVLSPASAVFGVLRSVCELSEGVAGCLLNASIRIGASSIGRVAADPGVCTVDDCGEAARSVTLLSGSMSVAFFPRFRRNLDEGEPDDVSRIVRYGMRFFLPLRSACEALETCSGVSSREVPLWPIDDSEGEVKPRSAVEPRREPFFAASTHLAGVRSEAPRFSVVRGLPLVGVLGLVFARDALGLTCRR